MRVLVFTVSDCSVRNVSRDADGAILQGMKVVQLRLPVTGFEVRIADQCGQKKAKTNRMAV